VARSAGHAGTLVFFLSAAIGAGLTEGRIDWVWGEAERRGMPVMLLPAPAQLHFVDRIAERHPALRITMFTEEIPWLTKEDKAWIMGRGLCAWIG
jgi:hypothetical protein